MTNLNTELEQMNEDDVKHIENLIETLVNNYKELLAKNSPSGTVCLTATSIIALNFFQLAIMDMPTETRLKILDLFYNTVKKEIIDKS